MQRSFWTKENLAELEARNTHTGASIYPLTQLPQAGPADAKQYFYDWCAYECEEGVTYMSLPFPKGFILRQAWPN